MTKSRASWTPELSSSPFLTDVPMRKSFRSSPTAARSRASWRSVMLQAPAKSCGYISKVLLHLLNHLALCGMSLWCTLTYYIISVQKDQRATFPLSHSQLRWLNRFYFFFVYFSDTVIILGYTSFLWPDHTDITKLNLKMKYHCSDNPIKRLLPEKSRIALENMEQINLRSCLKNVLTLW